MQIASCVGVDIPDLNNFHCRIDVHSGPALAQWPLRDAIASREHQCNPSDGFAGGEGVRDRNSQVPSLAQAYARHECERDQECQLHVTSM